MSERTETRMLDIAVLRASFRRDVGVSREQLARAVGISEATLERLVRAGIVEPDTADAARFSAASAARLERLLRLHHDLEIDLVGAAVVVDLLERMERLEADLERLRRQLR
jgi:plasmid maintenance system antidote protein VapI